MQPTKSMYSIHLNDSEPFGKIIEQFIARNFPRKQCSNSPLLVDLLTEEILGTKSTRYGPKPSPETQVAMREVLRKYVANQRPIPVMVPWGSEKPDGSKVDIAEFAALKTLKSLNERISDHYGPGLQFNLRIEDVSAPHLFYETPEVARINAAAYTKSLLDLIYVLEVDTFVRAVPESSLTTETAFNEAADKILPVMDRYVSARHENRFDPSEQEIAALGWKGDLSLTTIEFYLGQYERMYPMYTIPQKLHILARYMSAALARHHLKIRGDNPEWQGQFLDLSFVPPTPGVEGVFSRRVYYRTLPTDYTSNHIAPWRAKGYLAISNDNDVVPKLATFSEQKEYVKNCIELKRGTSVVHVQADYVLV